MTIEYELKIEDLIEFNLFHIRHSPSLQYQMLLWRVLSALLTAFLLFGGAYFLDSDRSLIGFAYILSIIGGVGAFFIYPPLYRAIIIRRTQKLLGEGDNKAILGPQKITVSSEGLFCKTRFSESTLNWTSIVKVVQDDNYIFLYIGAMNAIVVPKKAFLTNKVQQEFLDLINANRKLV